ncbi:glycine--tRNA ligase subunit beta [Anaerosinus massiliensis]|uniref:glycine--tRNA ligase subunit beta n=1 Tax=Massilibacillus massiliensis TaxID=1806837 RepID=UPI000A80DBA4|nr:glycine--tRNA ligase subunit beta [Massilibacillus massiliensis]
MRNDVLLEIGTEEIPARFMPGILTQIEAAAKEKFAALRIGYGSVRAVGTPRRIALIIKDVDEKQTDISSENKGPSVKVAFDAEGNPTKAGMGFAKGQKIDVKDLVVKGEYVYAIVHEKGQAVDTLLKTILSDLIHGLNFPKNMHWADLDMKFVRPIKWLVALFGSKIIDFSIAGVKTGNITRGHRFLSKGNIVIHTAAEYSMTLEKNFVIVDQDVRRTMIRTQIETLADTKGGYADITEDLLEEVVFLVEFPTALCGSFEEKYLNLPAETVITPMREHQRYFPVMSKDSSLMPLFITVRNGGAEHLEIVQHGNERVLRARLADAQFFFEEDCKIKLVDRLEKLKSVVFQEGLGSIFDKTNRLIKISGFLVKYTDKEDAVLSTIERAAELAKTDLVTGMVCEFTELQGIMGREYALLNGETSEVAEAIYEHYLPRFAGDALPKRIAGRLISIADKMDNIVATFSRGLIPTGSQDPYALRRQALGIVNILIEAEYNLLLKKLIQQNLALLHITDEKKCVEITQQIEEFFQLRLKNVLADEAIPHDIVDAVLNSGMDDIYATYLRAKVVAQEILKPEMKNAVQAFVRVGNLSSKAKSTEIDEKLLKTAEELDLYKAYLSTTSAVDSLVEGHDYKGAIEALMDLAAPIHTFFEKVMVMDKDESIKTNRLALLKSLTNSIDKIADFSKVIL